MKARKFDTLQYANSLKDAGIESKAAEAIAYGQAKANEDMMTNLPGYCDLITKSDLKTELANFATKADLVVLRSEFKSDLREAESKLELKIIETQSDIRNVEANIKVESKALESRLTLRLGVIMLSGITIVSVIFSVIFGVLQYIHN